MLKPSNSLLKINQLAMEKMTAIIESPMVQGMATSLLQVEAAKDRPLAAAPLFLGKEILSPEIAVSKLLNVQHSYLKKIS